MEFFEYNYELKENGERVDVDARINQSLEETLSKYEKIAKDQGRDLSRQYFANLAKRFGLELKIEFKD